MLARERFVAQLQTFLNIKYTSMLACYRVIDKQMTNLDHKTLSDFMFIIWEYQQLKMYLNNFFADVAGHILPHHHTTSRIESIILDMMTSNN